MSKERDYGEDWREIYRLLKQMVEMQKRLGDFIQSNVAPMMSVIEKQKKLGKAMSKAMLPTIKRIQEQQARLIEVMHPFIDWCKKMGKEE